LQRSSLARCYHLAFHPSGDLYVTGPTTSSYDRIYRITKGGEVSVFYRGWTSAGLAFDETQMFTWLLPTVGGAALRE